MNIISKFPVIHASLLVLLIVSISQAAEIRLHDRAIRCTQTLVTLGDVAEILPEPDDDVRALSLLVLVTAPAPGEEKTVDAVELRDMLARIGLKTMDHRITGAGQVTLVGEERFVNTKVRSASPIVQVSHLQPKATGSVPNFRPVSSSQRVVTPQLIRTLQEQLAGALSTYLNHCITTDPSKPADQPWLIRFQLDREQGRTLATGGQIADITGGVNPLVGKQRFQITLDSGTVVSVDAEVSLPRQAVVLRRSLPKGYIIGESDVVLDRVDQLRDEHYFVDVKDVIGKETVKSVRERDVLTDAMLRRPVWVRKGEVITIRSLAEGVVVSIEGIALQDGCEGDTISVETVDPEANSRHRRKQEARPSFLARVSAPKTAEVYAAPMRVSSVVSRFE